MQLSQHPEFDALYLYHQQIDRGCRAAVAAWVTSDDTVVVDQYRVRWTPASARLFVQSLSHLFQEYNRVLWQGFHYCQQCGGQCCVRDASDVRPFDLIAVALLDASPPVLPAQIDTSARGCIYLNGTQCTWPTTWRTIKCWSFYCLGSGPWDETASIGELYSAVTSELRRVVAQNLPEELRVYEAVTGDSLIDYLDDPVSFSNAVHAALATIFVNPFHARYPFFDLATQQAKPATGRISSMTANIHLEDEDALSLIVAMMEEAVEASSPIPPGVKSSPDQLLADLETLAWIVEGTPASGPKLLREMFDRYDSVPAPKPGERPTIWQRMAQQIEALLAN